MFPRSYYKESMNRRGGENLTPNTYASAGTRDSLLYLHDYLPGMEARRVFGHGEVTTVERGIGQGLAEGEFIAYDATRVGVTLCICSSSALDATGGTGGTRVMIRGLDNNFDLVREFVQLDGTTRVTLALTYVCVETVSVLGCGSNRTNVGEICVGPTSEVWDPALGQRPASLYGVVPAGGSVSQYILFGVPRNVSRQQTRTVVLSDNNSQNAGLHIKFRVDLGVAQSIFDIFHLFIVGSIDYDTNGFSPWFPGSVFWATGVATQGSHNVTISFQYTDVNTTIVPAV